MTQTHTLQFRFASRLAAIAGILLATVPTITPAQIAGDGSLGTQVNDSLTAPCTGVCTINGGVEHGVNLFHSFKEFSISTGGQAWFNNSSQIQNILTRVTGNSISTIDGLIKANGTANLFFLNPSGIIFGPNARLQIGGSFFASTASSFKFSDGSEFSVTQPQAPPLLTINIPLGLQYGKPIGSISQAGNLAVPPGQSLTLFGNTVTSTGSLVAPGGTIQMVGDRVALRDRAQIDVSSPSSGGTILIGGDYQGRGEIPNSVQTIVESNVIIKANATTQGNGGKVIIWADGVTKFDGTIHANGGKFGGDGGFVEVSGARNLAFQGRVDTSATLGQTGTLLLDPTNIRVFPGATPNPANAADGIWSVTEDIGDQIIGSDAISALLNTTALTLEATDTITFTPNANVFANSANTLTLHARTITLTNVFLLQRGGGNVILDTTQNRNTSAQTTQGTSIFLDNSIVGTENFGAVPQTGDLQVTTGFLSAINGAQLEASTFATGNAGNVKLLVTGTAAFDGKSPNNRLSGAFSTVERGANGNGGNVEIVADALTVTNGAQLATSTFGIGNAGSMKLTVTGAAAFEGTAITPNGEFSSGAFSTVEAGANGKGGNVEILRTSTLTLSKGARLDTSTFGAGNAGSVKLTVDGAARFDGAAPSGVLTLVRSQVGRDAIGNGGNIELTAGSLTVTNGAQLSVSTFNTRNIENKGNAGGIRLTVLRGGPAIFDGAIMTPDGEFPSGAFSTVERRAIGNGGTVELTAGSLTLTNGAQLSTSTLARGNAGSIKLTVIGAALVDGDSQNGVSTGIFSRVGAIAEGRGGNVELRAGSLTVSNGAQLSSSTSGIGDAGSIKLTVDGVTKISGSSLDGSVAGISSQVGFNPNGNAIGKGGSIELITNTLTVTNGGILDVSTFGTGDGGSMKLKVQGAAIFDGASPNGFFSRVRGQVGPRAVGQGGNIELTAGSLTVTNGARFDSSTFGTGNAGDLTLLVTGAASFDGASTGLFSSFQSTRINGKGGNIGLTADTLTVTNGAQFNTSTFGTGNAGNIKLTVTGSTTFDGTALDRRSTSGALSRVGANGNGKGGNVELTTGTLVVTNGAQLSASTAGIGDAGSVKLTVIGTATFDGTALDSQNVRFPSGAFSGVQSGGNGKGGGIELVADNLTVTNGAQLSASTFGEGDAGNIVVEANRFEAFNGGKVVSATASKGQAGNIIVKVTDQITLSGLSTGLFASTAPGSSGNGGNIIIDPRVVLIQDGAAIAVNSQGSGTGGSITLQAGRLELRDKASISAETASAKGGNITLNVQDLLLLRRNSSISATAGTAGTAQAGGDGGNITIRAPFIIGVLGENSDITANAFTGNGGNINITTNAIYGLRFQPKLTPFSDITASSQFGLSGTVAINTLGIDPNRGLVALPVNLTDPSQQIAQECVPRIGKTDSSFVVTGRGGIPFGPEEMVQTQPLLPEWVQLPEARGSEGERVRGREGERARGREGESGEIVEAQGWIVHPNGQVELVAELPQANVQANPYTAASNWVIPVVCGSISVK